MTALFISFMTPSIEAAPQSDLNRPQTKKEIQKVENAAAKRKARQDKKSTRSILKSKTREDRLEAARRIMRKEEKVTKKELTDAIKTEENDLAAPRQR